MQNSKGSETLKKVDHLDNALEALISGFKTPEKLLSFLSNAIPWVHEYIVSLPEYNTSKDIHHDLSIYLHDILPHWIKRGKGYREKMYEGVKNVSMFSDGAETVIPLISAFAYDQSNGGLSGDGYFQEQVKGLVVMYSVYQHIDKYMESKKR